jgi:hypothetical protein
MTAPVVIDYLRAIQNPMVTTYVPAILARRIAHQ